ncbi:MAG: helix-turn-helix domain-containing protein [Segetibacter sp.]
MKFPSPGSPVRGSKTGVPIMALLDLLGRSWAMGIIWHLNSGASTFREIQVYCENISPTILNKRLKELTLANLIQRGIDGYQLTKKGEELYSMISPLGKWAKAWAKSIKYESLKEAARLM